MVQEGLQNQEGSGSQSYDFEEKISKEKVDRIQESEEEILMAKQKPRFVRGFWRTVLPGAGKRDIVWRFSSKAEAEDWFGGKL